eukprot:3073095-Prymnesium_polylepis.1
MRALDPQVRPDVALLPPIIKLDEDVGHGISQQLCPLVAPAPALLERAELQGRRHRRRRWVVARE